MLSHVISHKREEKTGLTAAVVTMWLLDDDRIGVKWY